MSDLFTVLDGPPHTGTILDLSADVREWPVGDVSYRDTGFLHAHAQHEVVRWFRRVTADVERVNRRPVDNRS